MFYLLSYRHLLDRPVAFNAAGFFYCGACFFEVQPAERQAPYDPNLLDRGLHRNPLVSVCVLIKPHFIIPYFIKIVNKNIIWGGFGDFWSKNDRKNEKN